MLKIGRSLVRSQLVSLEYFIDIKSFPSRYGPGVDSASNRNEYQEHFLGCKGGRCIRLTTLPPSCAVVMKSGNLNFLKPSEPLRECNGTFTLLRGMIFLFTYRPISYRYQLSGHNAYKSTQLLRFPFLNFSIQVYVPSL